MTILELHHIAMDYGAQDVLVDVSFKINKGEKVGLIGDNGCGKSTILKLIAGIERPVSGTVSKVKGISTGYLEQHLKFQAGRRVEEEIASVFEAVNRMQRKMRKLEAQMANGASDQINGVMEQYGRLQEAFERADGYACQAKIDAVIDGLGIGAWRDQSVDVLSGGEKNLVGLAKILLGEPDLLLLDEPGNHLDFEGLAWLETFLQNLDRTVILVSHDRYMLDRVVNRVVEVEDGKASTYMGNYSAYRTEKLRQLLLQKAAYDNQQKEIQRLEEMIKRFELWGGEKNIRRARNKEKMLDRIDRIHRPVMDRQRIDPAFGAIHGSGKIALELRKYERKAGQRTLFRDVDLLVQSGERVGLVGSNGTGKSMLFKDIVAEAAWEHPTMRIGPRIKLGYYAQEHETLNENRTILEEICLSGELNRDQGGGVLSRFLFSWRDLDKKVGNLSGGEKSRVQLACLMVSGANMLLLDEPTNHLDIASREQVEDALEDFDGTLIVISHDRYFLDKIAERVIEVRDLNLESHVGNFSDFWAKRRSNKTPDGEIYSEVEKQIEALEDEKLRLERGMASAFEKRDFKRGDRLSRRLRLVEQQIENLYPKSP
ncbi:MAG: ABC-F family ATP-binding cassette domain-containing protein [Gemmatimonadetes bacterium]|nr:ABC-F family ATP-binding cassette domain-containing protein [Gemmatimonadota bacterium]